MFNLTSPVAGTAQTGYATPSFTVAADQAPDVNAKAYTVTGISGMSGARVHSVSDPFSLTMWRPKVPKTLPSPNPVTGRYASIGSNDYTMVGRKGVNYAANQAPLIAVSRTSFSIPAGADAYDATNVRALVSLCTGAAYQQASGIGDTCVAGTL